MFIKVTKRQWQDRKGMALLDMLLQDKDFTLAKCVIIHFRHFHYMKHIN